MPKSEKKIDKKTSSKIGKSGSKSDLQSKSGHNVKGLKAKDSKTGHSAKGLKGKDSKTKHNAKGLKGKDSKTGHNKKGLKAKDSKSGESLPDKVATPRARANMERVGMLARPPARRLQSLWDEKCGILPPDRRDKIKSALEEDYFLSPEQTEQYFQALNFGSTKRHRSEPGGMAARKEQADKTKELRQRQKWLVNFSAQVAFRLCDYIAKGNKEMLVSNRLRSIADVVLERVADILGEPKPSRMHPSRLPRFMVAISDRIAVWIENAVYRADAYEPSEICSHDEHMRLDAEKPLIC